MTKASTWQIASPKIQLLLQSTVMYERGMQIRPAEMSVTAKFKTNILAGTRRMTFFVATEMTTIELPPKATNEINIIGMAFPTEDQVTEGVEESIIVWLKHNLAKY